MHSHLNRRNLPSRRQVFALLALSFAFAAHAHAALTISGQPATSTMVAQPYSFAPSVSGTYSRYIRYSIYNKPAWLSFDSSTGRLTGTPSASDIGTYSNIVISASTRRSRARLPAFGITVKAAVVAPTPVTNAAPTIFGIPASSGSVGKLYSFTPSARDSNGDALTFSIQNKPSWAVFNPATGSLSGTPSVAGQHADIIITVSDSKASGALPAFAVTIAPPVLGSATVRWTVPSTNTDGTTLTNLTGFRVSYGTDPNQMGKSLELPSPTFSSVEIADLAPGTYYFSVKAYTAAGVESVASTVVWKTIL